MIDELYKDAKEAIDKLDKPEDISLKLSMQQFLSKALLLSVASHFEMRLKKIVIDFANEKSHGSPSINSLISKKAVERQFHTWFDWKTSSVTPFFSLFGAEFREVMREKILTSEELKDSISSFMETCGERNNIIHQDFISYEFKKTLDEVYKSYQNSMLFLETLKAELKNIK